MGAAADSAAAAEPRPRAMFAGKAWFWAPWPALVALDLWSKAEVFARMGQKYGESSGARAEYLVFHGKLLSFALVTWANPGTIWGLFQNGTVALMVLRCVAVAGLLWFVCGTARRARLQLAVLSLIFAGALGNLYDNFTRADRSVRDFLRFTGEWPASWGFPAFNVADSCITVGAIGLLVMLVREDRASAKARKQVSS